MGGCGVLRCCEVPEIQGRFASRVAESPRMVRDRFQVWLRASEPLKLSIYFQNLWPGSLLVISVSLIITPCCVAPFGVKRSLLHSVPSGCERHNSASAVLLTILESRCTR